MQFCIYFIVQFYFEVCLVVEETSYIGAYSKSIFIQLSPFWPFPRENYNLNSVSDMVETNGGPSNRDKGFSCFYLSLRFLSEYFLYLLWRISFDFNFKRGIFVDTHGMCNGYVVYHFRTMLLFMRAINQMTSTEVIFGFGRPFLKEFLSKIVWCIKFVLLNLQECILKKTQNLVSFASYKINLNCSSAIFIMFLYILLNVSCKVKSCLNYVTSLKCLFNCMTHISHILGWKEFC